MSHLAVSLGPDLGSHATPRVSRPGHVLGDAVPPQHDAVVRVVAVRRAAVAVRADDGRHHRAARRGAGLGRGRLPVSRCHHRHHHCR